MHIIKPFNKFAFSYNVLWIRIFSSNVQQLIMIRFFDTYCSGIQLPWQWDKAQHNTKMCFWKRNILPISNWKMKYSWEIKQKSNCKYWPHLNYPGSHSLHHSGIEKRCNLRQRRQILYGYMWPALYREKCKSHGRCAKLPIFPGEQTINIPPLMILPAPHSVFTI